MSFDENNDNNNQDSKKQDSKKQDKKPKVFFGLEVSDGVVYTIVVILTLIFVYQVSAVLQALN